MKTDRFALVAVITLAIAAMAPSAFAGIRGHENHGNTYRADMRQVRLLARHIDAAAAGLSDRAAARSRHPVYGGVATVRALRDLERAADIFRYRVERTPRLAWRVEAGYRDLLRAYDNALYASRATRTHPVERRGLARLGALIDDLADAYHPMSAGGRHDRRHETGRFPGRR